MTKLELVFTIVSAWTLVSVVSGVAVGRMIRFGMGPASRERGRLGLMATRVQGRFSPMWRGSASRKRRFWYA